MRLRSLTAVLAVAFVVLGRPPDGAATGADRLDRFRALAARGLAAAQLTEEPGDAYRELYALLDEEIVESLAVGGVFGSLAFLQDRLDAFGEAWGGTVVRLMRIGALVVGAFQLSDGPFGNSVRVYGPLSSGLPGRAAGDRDRPETALLTTISRVGRPTVHRLDAAERGPARFLIVWDGTPTGRGTRDLRIDLARAEGDGVRVVWSTAEVFPEGLLARRWSVRGAEIRVQYELQYPGWIPGCEGQTEHEDVYRLGADAAVRRVARRPLNAWHRDFRRVVTQMMDALAGSDPDALARVVPDAGLRRHLPRTLALEPACDAREPGTPERVSVAARDAERPWQLVFQRAPAGWRLVRAMPVLQ